MGQGAEDMDARWAWGGSREAVEPPAQAGGDDEKRERIKRVQRLNGCGMLAAKRIIEREDLINDIRAAETIDDIKTLLLRIV